MILLMKIAIILCLVAGTLLLLWLLTTDVERELDEETDEELLR